MRIRDRARKAFNVVLRPVGLRVTSSAPSPATVWDQQFMRWIREAEAAGRDPNDIGDERWAEDLLQEGLSQHYLPLVTPDSVVLELGPGSGRLTRHLVGRCREVIVVDSSGLVCEWIQRYLAGKGRLRVHLIEGPFLPMLGEEQVDAVFAHGVVEHLDLDELHWFLAEFLRILRPRGIVVFNFDNVMTDRGIEVMTQDGPGRRALFRVHHPESIQRVAEALGFVAVRVSPSPGRVAFAHLEKP